MLWKVELQHDWPLGSNTDFPTYLLGVENYCRVKFLGKIYRLDMSFFVIFVRKTVQLCQQAEKAGVAWITVHGRTTKQRGEPANWDTIRLVLNRK